MQNRTSTSTPGFGYYGFHELLHQNCAGGPLVSEGSVCDPEPEQILRRLLFAAGFHGGGQDGVLHVQNIPTHPEHQLRVIR